jgi:hypothetical protein
MEENRIPKWVLCMNLGTTRLRGRPRNRWQWGERGWNYSWWRRVAGKVHNREEWKKLLKTARNRRILHMPMELMNDVLNSNFIGITNLHVSGSLRAHHQELLAVHRLWYILCSCDDRLLPGVGWNSNLFLVLLLYPWWWAEMLPETCRVVIPIKLEFSASVGFIHREWVKNVYLGRVRTLHCVIWHHIS